MRQNVLRWSYLLFSNHTQTVHLLCGFDDVPCAVVVHVVFAANALAVAMVVMTLGLDFLERNSKDKDTEKDHLNRTSLKKPVWIF